MSRSGELTVQAFLTQQVTSNYNWCEKNGVIRWWQRPAVNVESNVPGGGFFGKVSVENVTNITTERVGDRSAVYTFNLVQEVAKPSGAAQRSASR